MLNREQNVQECDATEVDSSNEAGNIIIILTSDYPQINELTFAFYQVIFVVLQSVGKCKKKMIVVV